MSSMPNKDKYVHKMRQSAKISALLFIIFINISCDQISKNIVRTRIAQNERIELINDNFILTNVENTGAALSLGQHLPPVLKLILLQILPLALLLVLFIRMVRNNKYSHFMLISMGFIIGGGIGNIYDRILYASVTDFMYIQVGPLHTGIFNVADVSVVIGTLLLIVDLSYQRLYVKDKSYEL